MKIFTGLQGIFKYGAYPLAFALALPIGAGQLFAGDRESGLEAHVHGAGSFNVVVDQNDVYIELELPGMNVVGFEHRAETPEQKQAVETAIEQLGEADALWVADEAAECQFGEVDVHHHEPDADGDGEHSEFEASYHMSCQAPDKLTRINVNVFDVAKGLEELEVQLVSPSGQNHVEITHDDRSLMLNQ